MKEQPGLVVARFRRHVTVEDGSGQRHTCQIQSRGLDPVVGDEVRWYPTPDGGIVTALEPRRSRLQRIDKRGRAETVAANLTQLIVVAAPQPQPDWQVLDRYLCGAELAGLAGVVVLNKCDLLPETGGPTRENLDIYRAAGYRSTEVSAKSGQGLDELAQCMQGQRSAMVGQSGVGKSSLINVLIGAQAQLVGPLTEKGQHGQHTTSTAVLYRLPNGGELIDSPGVRNFAPPLDQPERLAQGFKEFAPYLGTCRFMNCRHLAEPDCAIKQAVHSGAISRARYESYTKLLALRESLPDSHH
jgi:ribosome biogenesis GTPase